MIYDRYPQQRRGKKIGVGTLLKRCAKKVTIVDKRKRQSRVQWLHISIEWPVSSGRLRGPPRVETMDDNLQRASV